MPTGSRQGSAWPPPAGRVRSARGPTSTSVGIEDHEVGRAAPARSDRAPPARRARRAGPSSRWTASSSRNTPRSRHVLGQQVAGVPRAAELREVRARASEAPTSIRGCVRISSAISAEACIAPPDRKLGVQVVGQRDVEQRIDQRAAALVRRSPRAPGPRARGWPRSRSQPTRTWGRKIESSESPSAHQRLAPPGVGEERRALAGAGGS